MFVNIPSVFDASFEADKGGAVIGSFSNCKPIIVLLEKVKCRRESFSFGTDLLDDQFATTNDLLLDFFWSAETRGLQYHCTIAR